jgi:hypothetical protein
MLCREALSNDKAYTTRFKQVYDFQSQMEKAAIKDFSSEHEFTNRYFKLQQLGWGGVYEDYTRIPCAEGVFLPFVRTRFNSHQPIDEGCVWLGNLATYPLIYVANNIARWISPYSRGGFVRKEPFLPYAEARKILPRLMNKVIYPDLDVTIF